MRAGVTIQKEIEGGSDEANKGQDEANPHLYNVIFLRDRGFQLFAA